MYEDVMRRIEEAVEASERWAEQGWPASFGQRGTPVPTLKDAEALPRNAVFRREALNYWNQVKLTGHDAALSGRKALEALRQGDECAAADALYFSQYVEKPFAESSRTWAPLYEGFCARVCG